MSEQEAGQETITLKIANKKIITDDLCLFELVDQNQNQLPEFTAGSHLAVRTPSGGMRQFSLCNDPLERHRYMLGVKAERDGRGGTVSMVDDTVVGDLLEVSQPVNQFPLKDAPEYIFVAGGIGITPILSMVQQVSREGKTDFKLIYCSRSPHATPFLQELNEAGLASSVTIHYDDGDPEKAYDFWDLFETPGKAQVYCCGPQALMEEIRGVTGHWPQEAIHFEEFHSGIGAVREDDKPFTIRHFQTDAEFEVGADVTILEALRDAGQDLRSSCESGTCGTCKIRLIEGDPDHRDLVLTDEERADHIMICVSRARSKQLVLDW